MPVGPPVPRVARWTLASAPSATERKPVLREITPGIRHLLDSMPGTPAYVVDAACNVLAWNPLATHFIGDLSGYEDRNMIRWSFLRTTPVVWSDEAFVCFTRATVADLRASYARYPERLTRARKPGLVRYRKARPATAEQVRAGRGTFGPPGLLMK